MTVYRSLNMFLLKNRLNFYPFRIFIHSNKLQMINSGLSIMKL
jgi:hypothetical protein